MMQKPCDKSRLERLRPTPPCAHCSPLASKKLGIRLEQPPSYSTASAVPDATAAAAVPQHLHDPETAASASDQPNPELYEKDFHFPKPQPQLVWSSSHVVPLEFAGRNGSSRDQACLVSASQKERRNTHHYWHLGSMFLGWWLGLAASCFQEFCQILVGYCYPRYSSPTWWRWENRRSFEGRLGRGPWSAYGG